MTGEQLLASPFPALMSRTASLDMRDSLDMTKNTSMFGFYAMLTLDRAAMIDAIKSMREETDDDEAMSIVDAMTAVRENLDQVAKLARMVEGRALIAAHVAFGMDWVDEPTPQSIWDATFARYDAALAIERAYGAEHIDPLVPDHLPIGPERNAAVDSVPAEAWLEDERLANIRYDIEDELFALPSPDLAAFARKVIICRADGRDLNGFDEMLVAEARRLTSGGAA
ncbi:hypothetical protein ACWGK7_03545 [Sphingomonas aurantiaca]